MQLNEKEKEDITDMVIESRDVEEDSIYAHKFAVMQQQIDEKDTKIQELELKQKEMCEEYCPKTERIKELEEENKKYIVQLTDEQYRNLVDIRNY